MSLSDELQSLRRWSEEELTGNILPFWSRRMPDAAAGGFIGRIDGQGTPDPGAEKGAVMTARILWTFSSAYRIFGKSEYLQTATRAMEEITGRFYDEQYGGVYWSVSADGTPLQTKKQVYALGFAIYGLAEYFRATGDRKALDYAVKLFESIEEHSFDPQKNGYFEAFNRDWSPIGDMRLSDKDRNDCKTMNTHLHILEPYTALYRVWKDDRLEDRILNLINIFTDRILDKDSGHLMLFFDEDWNSTVDMVSYGHDIEASWLIWEAVEVLADETLEERLRPIVTWIAEAAAEGYTARQGMMYEADMAEGSIVADRHWWVQAETVVGYFNLWQMTGDEDALAKALDCAEFIRKFIVDSEGGEWFWCRKADGTPDRDNDKAGFWKCPYHNGRMCMELIERLDR